MTELTVTTASGSLPYPFHLMGHRSNPVPISILYLPPVAGCLTDLLGLPAEAP